MKTYRYLWCYNINIISVTYSHLSNFKIWLLWTFQQVSPAARGSIRLTFLYGTKQISLKCVCWRMGSQVCSLCPTLLTQSELCAA